MVPGRSPSYAIAELEADIDRLKWPGKILPYRCFTLEFMIKNNGKTDANDCSYGVKAKWPGQVAWTEIANEKRAVVRASAPPFALSCPFYLPLSEQIPATIDFRVRTEFKTVHGKSVPREILCRWQSENNSVYYLGEFNEATAQPE